jgi:ribosome-associated toxin RatA of RatAB toxin-antitoxin module
MPLEKVAAETVITGMVRKEAAWEIVSDFSRYPAIMENVDEVRVHERTPRSGKSEWFVNVEGAPLSWIERDVFDPEHFRIRFESLGGDFEKVKGRWSIEDYRGEGIRVVFEIEYLLGIPVIEEVLGHILKEKMQSNIDTMVAAIRGELLKKQVEERRHRRIDVGRYVDLSVNGRAVRSYIVNVSRGGMRIQTTNGGLKTRTFDLEIGANRLKAGLLDDSRRKDPCLRFSRDLSPKSLERILKILEHSDARRHERRTVQKSVTLNRGKKAFRAFVENISPGGMFFTYRGRFKGVDDSFRIGSQVLELGTIVQHDPQNRVVRLAFRNELDRRTYDAVLNGFGLKPRTAGEKADKRVFAA